MQSLYPRKFQDVPSSRCWNQSSKSRLLPSAFQLAPHLGCFFRFVRGGKDSQTVVMGISQSSQKRFILLKKTASWFEGENLGTEKSVLFISVKRHMCQVFFFLNQTNFHCSFQNRMKSLWHRVRYWHHLNRINETPFSLQAISYISLLPFIYPS